MSDRERNDDRGRDLRRHPNSPSQREQHHDRSFHRDHRDRDRDDDRHDREGDRSRSRERPSRSNSPSRGSSSHRYSDTAKTVKRAVAVAVFRDVDAMTGKTGSTSLLDITISSTGDVVVTTLSGFQAEVRDALGISGARIYIRSPDPFTGEITSMPLLSESAWSSAVRAWCSATMGQIVMPIQECAGGLAQNRAQSQVMAIGNGLKLQQGLFVDFK